MKRLLLSFIFGALSTVSINAQVAGGEPQTSVVQGALGTQSSDLAEADQLHQSATTAYQEGRIPEAASLAEQVLSIRQKLLPAEHPAIANAANNLARIYVIAGRYDEAGALYRRVLTDLSPQKLAQITSALFGAK